MNDGLSWQPATLPSTITCGADAVAAYGPDGTLYAGGISTMSVTVAASTPTCAPPNFKFGTECLSLVGFDSIVSSTNNGQTWTTTPVKTVGTVSQVPGRFAAGSGMPSETFDRPFLAVDQSTNTVYAVGHNINTHEGFVTASTNDGQSFGKIYAIDSPTYPQGGNGGGTLAAANGVLAVSYTAASAPGATCPCTIFETSTNDGATFSRHIVTQDPPTVSTTQDPPLAGPTTDPEPFIAANPAHRGQFALTIINATETANLVYTTNDFGQRWSGPTTVAETPPPLPGGAQFKPWIAYGSQGQLVLVWRTWLGTPNSSAPNHPSTGPTSKTPYDVWAAVSNNGGHFSTPLQIAPAAPYPPGYTFGDDFSFVIADSNFVYIGWGDGRDIPRGGGTQTWFARVAYSTFR